MLSACPALLGEENRYTRMSSVALRDTNNHFDYFCSFLL